MPKSKSARSKTLTALLSVSGLLGVYLIWYFSVLLSGNSRIIPGPNAVIARFFGTLVTPVGKYSIIGHMAFSLVRVLVGFSLSSFAGIALGVVMGKSRIAEAIIRPVFELFRPIPGVAWIPMAILWFGIGEQAKYFIIFMSGFSHIVVNTFSGARRVDKQMIGIATMLGANKMQTFFYVVMPSCVPYIFAGLQVSLATSWMAVLAAEMVSSTEGAGWLIIAGSENGDVVQIFVGIIAISIVGLLIAIGMRAVEQYACRWRAKAI